MEDEVKARVCWRCKEEKPLTEEHFSPNNRSYNGGFSRKCRECQAQYSTKQYSKNIEHHTWLSMVNRCTNPRNVGYKDYGARGITVCDLWMGEKGFQNFFEDLGPRPKGCSLDRIDNEKGYSPENCRWATRVQQARNMQTSRLIEYQGDTRTIAEWSEVTGITRGAIQNRLLQRLPLEEVFQAGRKPQKSKKIRVCHPRRKLSDKTTFQPEYKAWKAMVYRCTLPHHQAWANYGGRGILVCDLWRESYEAFLADVGPRPSPGHSLDRIDVDGNYEPGNVRWSLRIDQARNTRKTKWLTYRGETRSIIEWSEVLNIPYETLRNRIRAGWTVEKVFTPLKRVIGGLK